MLWGVLGFYAKFSLHMAYDIPNVNALSNVDCIKILFYTFKYHFIYFTNLFLNLPYILVSIFIYNLLK